MILWTGWEVLVVVFILVGQAAAYLIATYLSGDPDYIDLHGWPLGVGYFAAAVMCWLLDSRVTKSVARAWHGPETGRPLQSRPRAFALRPIRWCGGAMVVSWCPALFLPPYTRATLAIPADKSRTDGNTKPAPRARARCYSLMKDQAELDGEHPVYTSLAGIWFSADSASRCTSLISEANSGWSPYISKLAGRNQSHAEWAGAFLSWLAGGESHAPAQLAGNAHGGRPTSRGHRFDLGQGRARSGEQGGIHGCKLTLFTSTVQSSSEPVPGCTPMIARWTPRCFRPSRRCLRSFLRW